MTTQTSLLPSVPSGPRNSKNKGEKKRFKRKNGNRKRARGRRERNGDDVSKGEWWLWIGWPSSGHVRSFPERGGSVSWSKPGTLCGATVWVSVSDWLCARSFLPPSTFSFVEIHFLLNPFYYSLSRPVSLIFNLSVRFTSLSLSCRLALGQTPHGDIHLFALWPNLLPLLLSISPFLTWRPMDSCGGLHSFSYPFIYVFIHLVSVLSSRLSAAIVSGWSSLWAWLCWLKRECFRSSAWTSWTAEDFLLYCLHLPRPHPLHRRQDSPPTPLDLPGMKARRRQKQASSKKYNFWASVQCLSLNNHLGGNSCRRWGAPGSCPGRAWRTRWTGVEGCGWRRGQTRLWRAGKGEFKTGALPSWEARLPCQHLLLFWIFHLGKKNRKK